ncbi:MAG: tripartite tricarboxylate transporter permease [Thermoplasmata archaeon]|nr:tripartite tricarboxylate transporter permease [Thermoplasmata archaeon]
MIDLGVSLFYIGFALLGVIVSAVLCLVPGLHVYNVMGFAFLIYFAFLSEIQDHMYFIMFLVGLVVGYSILFTIPTIYLSAPDDSTVWIMYPSQKYLMQGRGHEAVLLTTVGAIVGVLIMLIAIPLFMQQLKLLREIIKPHMFWIVGAVVMFILLSEFPKDFDRGKSKLKKLWVGWSTILAGYLTFLLSSILGIIIFNKTLVPADRAFQTLGAVFIGMFAASSLLVAIFTDKDIPKQTISRTVEVKKEEIFRGGVGGTLGGLFAAFIPAITAGVGALLAGHATAAKGERTFIISQGSNRVLYFVGAVVLFFTAIGMRKGALTIGMNLFYTPETQAELYIVLAGIAIGSAFALGLILILSRGVLKLIQRVRYQTLSIVALIGVTLIVFFMLSWQGLIIYVVSTGIGLIPVLFHSRRMNCLAVILVPIWLNMSGIGGDIAAGLGLF